MDQSTRILHGVHEEWTGSGGDWRRTGGGLIVDWRWTPQGSVGECKIQTISNVWGTGFAGLFGVSVTPCFGGATCSIGKVLAAVETTHYKCKNTELLQRIFHLGGEERRRIEFFVGCLSPVA